MDLGGFLGEIRTANVDMLAGVRSGFFLLQTPPSRNMGVRALSGAGGITTRAVHLQMEESMGCCRSLGSFGA